MDFSSKAISYVNESYKQQLISELKNNNYSIFEIDGKDIKDKKTFF